MLGFRFWVRGFIVLTLTLVHVGMVLGQDAQWRGPNRDGIFPDEAAIFLPLACPSKTSVNLILSILIRRV
ncbi:MAG: hypothetical protein U9N86_08255 [Bacteroidota bacterium]|nr:hypothetical protein [Bacteroidota bacterium]